MVDIGAIIRAIKLGYPDRSITSTFDILPDNLEIIKRDFVEIQALHSQGKTYQEAANLLMQPQDIIWYAYHVIETDSKKLEEEILAEGEGEPRVGPPPSLTQEQPPKEREKKVIKKEHIDKALQTKAETPTGEALMERAGEAGKEIALTCQALGQYVIDILGPMATRLNYGYMDFLNYIYRFWLDNCLAVGEKDAEISNLREANRQLQSVLDEDILRVYVARSMDRVLIAALLGGGGLELDALMAYKKMLETEIDIKFLKEKAGVM